MNSNYEDNKFKEQLNKIDKCQKNSEKSGYFVDAEKVSPFMKVLVKYPFINLLLGSVIFVFTGLSIMSSYKTAKGIKELFLPIVYNFIPFVISFILIKIGMKGLKYRKN
ncbi:hypothetical protein M2651_01850 [Clostridium sp. SYSU_GA19001]|uniref:hypothetical protein n=1 Tax=Clostridium caldaquaticum TaxID=2940653 RepID=UPI0020775AB5|nr:hypothetical protein [Clostridium caldaquaticum]MCM8709764.1 hypothetical protein [Clostridium caldaquaticum]